MVPNRNKTALHGGTLADLPPHPLNATANVATIATAAPRFARIKLETDSDIHSRRPRRCANAIGSVARLRLLQGPHVSWMLLIQFEPPLDSATMWSAW